MDIRKAIQIIRSSILQPSGANAAQPANTGAAPPDSNRQNVLDELEKVGRRAVLLRRTGLPVPGSHDARSFIGGLPRLPPHLEWPGGGTTEEPSAWTFAAQIDLAEVPLTDSPLPRSGTLYFFYYSGREWVEEDEVRVLHHEGAGNEFPEREPPPHLVTYFNDSWSWLGEDDLIRRVGFKYPIRFVPFTSYRSYLGESWDDTSVQQPTDQELKALRNNELNTRLADEVSPPTPYFHKEIESAGTAWPFAWGVIEHSARALRHSIDRLFEWDYQLRDKSPETLAELKRIREQIASWAERAASHSLAAPCDESTQQRFNEEWTSFETAIKPMRIYACRPEQFRNEALRLVCYICASTSPEAAAIVPEPFRRALEAEARWQPPAPNRSGHQNVIHQMLGYGECVQNAGFDHIDDVMLLQLHGDIGFDWHSNIGCSLQFWITPDALAQRDFDAAKVTFECD